MALSADSQLKHIITRKGNGGHTPLYSFKWSWCSQQISTAELIVKNKWRLKDFFMLEAIKPYQGIRRGATGKGEGGTFALTTFNFGTT